MIALWFVVLIASAPPMVFGATEAPAKPPSAVTHRRNPKDGAELVWVPAGEFLCGMPGGQEEITQSYPPIPLPPHKVRLTGFWIYQYEVTNEMFRRFVEATGYKRLPCRWTNEPPPYFVDVIIPKPAGFPRPEWWEKIKRVPVAVDWYDAEAYARWAGAALPTELQWEKAARGTDGRRFPWGNQPLSSLVEKFWTGPVGSYPEDISPYGAVEMFSNAKEWTSTKLGELVVVRGYHISGPWAFRQEARDDRPTREEACDFWEGRSVCDRAVYPPEHGPPEMSERYGTGEAGIGFRCVILQGSK